MMGEGPLQNQCTIRLEHYVKLKIAWSPVPGNAKPVRGARLLNGGANVNHGVSEGTVVRQLPKRASGEIDQVIVLDVAE